MGRLCPHSESTCRPSLLMAIVNHNRDGLFRGQGTRDPAFCLSVCINMINMRARPAPCHHQDGIFEVKALASIQDAASGNKREVGGKRGARRLAGVTRERWGCAGVGFRVLGVRV